MLGTVKMEGHETSDWNSYYADTQEVRELRVRCPSEREKRGPGEGRGAEGGSESGDRFALRLPPAPSRLSSAKPPRGAPHRRQENRRGRGQR